MGISPVLLGKTITYVTFLSIFSNFSVPDDQNRGHAFWRTGICSLWRTSWWHGRLQLRKWHGRVWWGWFRQFHFRSGRKTSPMSTMLKDVFVQPSIGPAHTGETEKNNYKVFINQYSVFLMHLILFYTTSFFFFLFTGAHRRKALQMLILRSKIQAIVPCATTHKTSYWYKKNFCHTKILCDFRLQ